MATPHTPVGSQGSRYLAILVGVIVGYVVGRMFDLELTESETEVDFTAPICGV